MHRLIFPVIGCFLGCAQACTLAMNTGTVNFGEVPLGAAIDQTEVAISASVTCPVGVNYQLYPTSSSANSYTEYLMTHNGASNGKSYSYLKRTDGVLLTKSNSASYISGTGTGVAQDVQLKIYLGGSLTSPTVPVAKLGTFSASPTLLQLKRLDNNATFNAGAVSVSGRVVGLCSVSTGGNLDYGVVEKPLSTTTHELTTTLSIACSDTVHYSVYADLPSGSTNNWVAGQIKPTTGLAFNFSLRPTGNGAYSPISNGTYLQYVGTNAPQIYDLKSTLSVEPTASGAWNFTIRPTVVF